MPFKFRIPFFILLISFPILFFRCSNQIEYSNIPAIEFKEFQLIKYNNSNRDSVLKIIISFVDGDGDLGLTQEDTIAPFNPGSVFYKNYYAYYYEKVGDTFFQVRPEDSGIPIGDTIRYSYRFPDLRTQSNNKALKGDIEVTIGDINPVKSSILRFEIYIFDRALNISNKITTPAIIYSH